jgi:hypothetical protein
MSNRTKLILGVVLAAAAVFFLLTNTHQAANTSHQPQPTGTHVSSWLAPAPVHSVGFDTTDPARQKAMLTRPPAYQTFELSNQIEQATNNKRYRDANATRSRGALFSIDSRG